MAGDDQGKRIVSTHPSPDTTGGRVIVDEDGRQWREVFTKYKTGMKTATVKDGRIYEHEN